MGADVGAGARRGCSPGRGRGGGAGRARLGDGGADAAVLVARLRAPIRIRATRSSVSQRPSTKASPKPTEPCSGPRQAAGSLMRTVALESALRAVGAAAAVLDDLDLAAARAGQHGETAARAAARRSRGHPSAGPRGGGSSGRPSASGAPPGRRSWRRPAATSPGSGRAGRASGDGRARGGAARASRRRSSGAGAPSRGRDSMWTCRRSPGSAGAEGVGLIHPHQGRDVVVLLELVRQHVPSDLPVPVRRRVAPPRVCSRPRRRQPRPADRWVEAVVEADRVEAVAEVAEAGEEADRAGRAGRAGVGDGRRGRTVERPRRVAEVVGAAEAGGGAAAGRVEREGSSTPGSSARSR